MHHTSIYGVTVDLARSHGAYLWDLTTQREVLDLFGSYSSLPLGYNHPAFDAPEFVHEIIEHAKVKLANCEMRSRAAERFHTAFMSHPSMAPFAHAHFCCTGALAIEAAIKTAMVATGRSRVWTQREAFHGIYGYAGLLADATGPAGHRVWGLPDGQLWLGMIDSPDEIAACVVEPIRCTSGDVLHDALYLQDLRAWCDEVGALLVFDEVQTGFGGTGTLWYFEQFDVVPDIVVFGKKAQVSGILVRESCDAIFNTPEMLECTFDGDVVDMIRCRAILETYARDKVLDNVTQREAQLVAGIPGLRHVGLLMALDFASRIDRDEFVQHLWLDEATMVIPTGERTVRLRPNLAITAAECDDVIARVCCALLAVAA